ncbi:MAG: methylmalonyl-CoA mutase family protein, partial [Caldilinea sp.]
GELYLVSTEPAPVTGDVPTFKTVEEAAEAAKKLRAERDNTAVNAVLAKIEQAAREPQAALMPLIVEAVETYATLGEICDTLRGVFGEYTPENWV